MCFSSFLSTLTKRKVELSNGNWKEIERVEVNLDNHETPNLVEEIEENNEAVEKTNGNIINEIEEKTNGDSKGLMERIDDIKVWLLFFNDNNSTKYYCMLPFSLLVLYIY